ncbi:ABC transporter permease subunit [Microbacterium sp. EYE_5]|uniref:ABC transporter permease n=1 Tax=unclassified Microbacterium TaxID=2609290 RepID=UPI0020030B60|nr:MULTISPECIES: ABC transporter permease subunit [unclassified Microbacterium]MCK6080137.1 ABC transporter permease subunit [Microbacterium sp. EYE_382]MCK6085408.1 ABC transporter permease subunit [Microbacterium sp. EYE_384]MCK6122367.1 ABC transporter permease subunit [Microbacterium sp. EYE_80]MCK6126171.1 ABC transporter permease subunit [Microbacterium sp. EYE_79]MCK6141092.1 ABC transporter permease subunit [Microbacterium sp. EYE_39]
MTSSSLAPSRTMRLVIGIVVGIVFAVPFLATAMFTLTAADGTLTLDRWAALFDPAAAARYRPVWTGLVNSLVLAVVTVAIVLLVFAPTMVLVHLRFPRLRRGFEFLALLPITIPAIVLVVGLAPIYLQIGRTLGTGAWTLAFAYGVLVLPFAYRSIQAAIDAVDLRTLTEAARTLGAGWPIILFRVVAPNLRQGLLAASLISVAVVLGEFTIASLLNRQVLQTGLVVINKQDAWASAIFTLLALAFAFVLLLAIGRAGRAGSERNTP